MRTACIFLVALSVGCGVVAGGGDGGRPDTGRPVLLDGDGELVFADGSRGNGDVTSVVRLADSLFEFDPTIDPAATPETNTTNIEANVTGPLASCPGAGVTTTGTSVTVDFGASPGCTLPNGVVASGSVTLALTKAGSTTTIAFTFASLVVNQSTVSGTMSFATSNGTTFTIAADLVLDGTSWALSLTVAGTAGAWTLDGTATMGAGDVATTLTVTSLHYSAGDCYPDGGTVAYAKGLTRLTATFSAATADSGVVTVTQGRITTTKTLPAYGSCPSA